MSQNKPRSRSYTQAEITKIIKKVCENYSTGEYALESCCENAGVPSRTFRNWFKTYEDFGEDIPAKWKYFAELAALYARTKENMRKMENEMLVEKAMSSLMKLVSGFEKEDTIMVYREKQNKNGEKFLELINIKKIKRQIGPNVKAVMFVLSKLYPEVYGDKATVIYIDSFIEKYKGVSDEELEEELARLRSDLDKPQEDKK